MFKDLFGLTRNVLNGHKIMTRRIIKLKDGCSIEKVTTNGRDVYYFKNSNINEHGEINNVPVSNFDGFVLAKTQYQVSETVAIAQPYSKTPWLDPETLIRERDKWVMVKDHKGWNNKMFVCADLMPHHICITDIRIERLQDISDEDCLREGVRLRSEPSKYQEVWNPEYTFGDGKYHAKYPRAAFAALIDRVSGKGTWDSNPYVFVYEFKLID